MFDFVVGTAKLTISAAVGFLFFANHVKLEIVINCKLSIVNCQLSIVN